MLQLTSLSTTVATTPAMSEGKSAMSEGKSFYFSLLVLGDGTLEKRSKTGKSTFIFL
jgi:hypothetical protein